MKISINFLVVMMKFFSDGQPVYYFSKNCYCYYHRDLFEQYQLSDGELSKINIIPVPSVNQERLMKLFLKSIDIPIDIVINEVCKENQKTKNCLLDPRSSEFDFCVCFRFFIDGRVLRLKNGNEIDLSKEWNEYQYQTILPKAKNWCQKNNIHYYTKDLPHRRYFYKKQYSQEVLTKRDTKFLSNQSGI